MSTSNMNISQPAKWAFFISDTISGASEIRSRHFLSLSSLVLIGSFVLILLEEGSFSALSTATLILCFPYSPTTDTNCRLLITFSCFSLLSFIRILFSSFFCESGTGDQVEDKYLFLFVCLFAKQQTMATVHWICFPLFAFDLKVETLFSFIFVCMVEREKIKVMLVVQKLAIWKSTSVLAYTAHSLSSPRLKFEYLPKLVLNLPNKNVNLVSIIYLSIYLCTLSSSFYFHSLLETHFGAQCHAASLWLPAKSVKEGKVTVELTSKQEDNDDDKHRWQRKWECKK